MKTDLAADPFLTELAFAICDALEQPSGTRYMDSARLILSRARDQGRREALAEAVRALESDAARAGTAIGHYETGWDDGFGAALHAVRVLLARKETP